MFRDVRLRVSTRCDDEYDDDAPELESAHGSNYLFYGFHSEDRNGPANAAPGLQVWRVNDA